MNKDVIYIEPDDDITDVITHIKSAKEKVVALVPPKKMGVLRSAVNIKLIMKNSKRFNKVVVLVTADPSILKLAATVGIPVAKTLQSRPVIPKLAAKEENEESDVETIEEDEVPDDEDIAKTPSPKSESKKKDAEINLNSAQLESDKKSGKKSEKDKKDGKKIPNFDKYRKFIIVGAVTLVAVVGFLVWALGFSAAADITVKIRTSSSSFAENINFVSKESEVNASEGKLLLEKVEYVKENKVDFTPTGEKDFGNKASGKLTVSLSLKTAGSLSVPTGATFKTGDLTFVASADASVSWDGGLATCGNIQDRYCVLTTTVNVIAYEGGTKYNIESGQKWSSDISGLYITNSSAFSGGTTDVAKVVTKEDIEKAKEQLSTDSNGKDELLSKINSDDMIVIDSSYSAKTDDPKSSPAEGEKVSGDKASLSAKTTYSVYVVNKASIKEFVTTSIQANLGPDQKVYDIGSPFFERFLETDGKFSAKLKTSIKTGPEVSEEDIMNKSKGKKIGEVQSLLQSINGVSKVEIDTPYPWVSSVPDDEEKITISIEVEE